MVPASDLVDAERKMAFAELEKLLSESKLPCQHGPHRWAKASEFMLMHLHAGEWAFKHGDTRNYLFVSSRPPRLRIPMTDEPFHLGYFDEY